jgi:energy-coupling factor transporter ATP-binding protein EcfA2
MIEFRDVTYQFSDGVKGLDKVNIHIRSGEKVAVIGANGSGKTTFALHINGILRPTNGEIIIGGLNPSDENDKKRLKQKVGLVFQNPDNQLVTMTVEREIAFSLENQNMDRREMTARVAEMLDLFGLSDYRHSLTSDLSGGEKQKLALASVLVTEPSILVLDEPDSYLDQAGVKVLDETIGMLLARKKDMTIIRITQYSQLAEAYERLIVFKDGSIAGDGKPEDIFNDGQFCQMTNIEVPLHYRIKNSFNFPGSIYSEGLPKGAEKSGPKSIRLNKVEFRYDTKSPKNIFDNVNAEIKSGRIYGLVGPTGSGKSTLLQLIAGLLKPIDGEILYDGFDLTPGKIVISFQQSERQFFLETVHREIKFGAENIDRPDPEKIANDCYKLIGLNKGKFAERDPFTLSGGEKRRLSFGVILSLEPLFIFFDEPTCGLDYAGLHLFKELIHKLKNNGTGVILVSHQGNIILELADEVLNLQSGKLESYQTKRLFFESAGYQDYLSVPELVAWQLEKLGELSCFSESDLHNTLRSEII